MRPSQQESPLALLDKSGSCEVSAYGGEQATIPQIKTHIHQLAVAFPNMSPEFWQLLSVRITKNGITASRLEAAVASVIDNFTYQRLTIADILGEGKDKRYRLFSYPAMVAECQKVGGTTDDYTPIRLRGREKPVWVSKADKALYNIPDEL